MKKYHRKTINRQAAAIKNAVRRITVRTKNLQAQDETYVSTKTWYKTNNMVFSVVKDGIGSMTPSHAAKVYRAYRDYKKWMDNGLNSIPVSAHINCFDDKMHLAALIRSIGKFQKSMPAILDSFHAKRNIQTDLVEQELLSRKDET